MATIVAKTARLLNEGPISPAGSRPNGYVAHIATPGPIATSARERGTGKWRGGGVGIQTLMPVYGLGPIILGTRFARADETQVLRFSGSKRSLFITIPVAGALTNGFLPGAKQHSRAKLVA